MRRWLVALTLALGGCAAPPPLPPLGAALEHNLTAMRGAERTARSPARRDAVFAAYARGDATAATRTADEHVRVASPGARQ